MRGEAVRAITRSTYRKLGRMKWRLVTICSVISLAMAMLVSGLYSGEVMDSSIDTYFDEAMMPDLFVDMSAPVNISDMTFALNSSKDVGAYDVRLKLTGTYDNEGDTYTALFIGVRDPARHDINKLKLDSGRFYTNPGEAVAVSGMEDRGVKTGSALSFDLNGRPMVLNVTGTISGPEFVFTTAFGDYAIPVAGSLVVVILPIEVLQRGLGPVANEAIIIIKAGGSKDNAVSSLEGLGVKSVLEQGSHPSKTFMTLGANKMKNLMPLISVIFMFIGLISIFMTMLRLVQNDSRYIGVMMAMGYERAEIVRAYLLLGGVICVIGNVVGTGLSVLFARSIVVASLAMFFQVDVVYPFSVMPFLAGILFTFGSVMLSVAIPVHLITRRSVKEALEYKPTLKVMGTKSLGGNLSRVTVMGLRNSVRNPKRTAATVFVIAMTIAVAGSWPIIVESAMGYIDDQIAADTWHLRADFGSPVPTSSVNETFLGLNGGDADYIVTFTYLTVEAGSGGHHKSAVVLGCDELGKVRHFDLQEGALDFSAAVITNTLASDLEIGPGDEIDLVLGSQHIELKVAGVVLDIMAGAVYTDRANIASMSPQNVSAGAFVKLKDPSRTEERAVVMRSVPEVSRVLVHSDISRSLNELLGGTLPLLYMFFVMFLFITIAVSGSLVIISSMERDIEYATLDTLGVSKGRVALSILSEMGLLALMASLVSVPLAYLMAEVMALIMQEVIFYFPVVFVLWGTILTMVMGSAFVMMSSAVPIRYMAKLNTERTIRERLIA